MTVAELIAALKKLDPKLNVYAGEETFTAREVIQARKEYDIACNDMICHYVFLTLGDTP